MSTSSASPKQLLEQRTLQREHDLIAEKAKVDDRNRAELDAQQERHQAKIQERKANAVRISEEAAARVQQARNEQMEEISKLNEEIKAANQLLKKDQQERGNAAMSVESEKLEKKRKELEELLEKKREQMKKNLGMAEEIEKRRQEGLQALDAKREADQKAFEERLITLNKEMHEGRLQREDKLTNVAQSQHNEQMRMMTRNDGRIMDSLMLTSQLQAASQLEVEFEPFQLKCNTLRRHHTSLVTEYNLIEPKLLKDHERLQKGKECKSDMYDLMESLRIFTAELAAFSAAGSTKEQEFAKMIGDLTKITDGINTEFNAIQSKIEGDDDDDDKNEKGGAEESGNLREDRQSNQDGEKGILNGIMKAKELMALMSPIIQEFNVIRANKTQAALADQMQALTMSVSRSAHTAIEGSSSEHAAIMGPSEE